MSKMDDRIRLADAIGWLDAFAQVPPGCLDSEGVDMMKVMIFDAKGSLRNAVDGGGMILRSDAVARIDAVLTAPPTEISTTNAGYWRTIKSTLKDAMMYPPAYEEVQ